MKNDLIAEAMSQIHGYSEAERAATVSARWLRELRANLGPQATDFGSPVQSELADAAAGDGKFPAGVGMRHVQAVQAVQAGNEEIHQVQRFHEDSLARKRDAISNGSAPALAFLNEALAGFVDELLELTPELMALPDLETIAETGNTKALALRKRRAELVETYLQIRAAQTTITHTVLDSLSDSTLRTRGRQAVLRVGQVRQAIDVEKAWTDRRSNACTEAKNRRLTGFTELMGWWGADPAPILAADDWGAPLPGRDLDEQTAALIRVAENTNPWVPTVDQLLRAEELAEMATSPLYRQGDDERIAKALEALADVTGHASTDAPAPTGAAPRPRGPIKLTPAQGRALLHARNSR
ncbi:hypothetical protein SB659_07700 [Arthrobacter sp. SIMBA_036]|uniref:hypothetical protein n=1 Tax=Arthrobacter sp. SIMBA_036 TaxID=3085778 RepID=UPI00397DE1E6